MKRSDHDAVLQFIVLVLFLVFAAGVAHTADNGETIPCDCFCSHCDREYTDVAGVLAPMSSPLPLTSARAPELRFTEAPPVPVSRIFHPPILR